MPVVDKWVRGYYHILFFTKMISDFYKKYIFFVINLKYEE